MHTSCPSRLWAKCCLRAKRWLRALLLLLATVGQALSARGMHKVQGLNDGSTITTQEDGTRHLVVADGVRSIQSLRFSFHKLTSVVLPSTLQTIGEARFALTALPQW